MAGEHRRIAVATAVTFIAAAIVVGSLVITRSEGPPGSPRNVRARAATCDEPCIKLDPRVILTWTGPTTGAPVSGYRVFKDGSPLPGAGNLDPSTTTLVDRNVELGVASAYQVSALGGGQDSAMSRQVVGEPPLPPVDLAGLDGVYRVRLTVRRARALGTFLGIDDPVRGRAGTDRWTFDPICEVGATACPTRWEQLPGRISPAGRAWHGTLAGPAARCGGGTRVPAPIDLHLRSERVGVDDSTWVVRSFRGRVQVSFRCPGFPASVGRMKVHGIRI